MNGKNNFNFFHNCMSSKSKMITKINEKIIDVNKILKLDFDILIVYHENTNKRMEKIENLIIYISFMSLMNKNNFLKGYKNIDIGLKYNYKPKKIIFNDKINIYVFIKKFSNVSIDYFLENYYTFEKKISTYDDFIIIDGKKIQLSHLLVNKINDIYTMHYLDKDIIDMVLKNDEKSKEIYKINNNSKISLIENQIFIIKYLLTYNKYKKNYCLCQKKTINISNLLHIFLNNTNNTENSVVQLISTIGNYLKIIQRTDKKPEHWIIENISMPNNNCPVALLKINL
jgi:hypothetical protein